MSEVPTAAADQRMPAGYTEVWQDAEGRKLTLNVEAHGYVEVTVEALGMLLAGAGYNRCRDDVRDGT